MKKIIKHCLFILVFASCTNENELQNSYVPLIYDRYSETAMVLGKDDEAYSVDWIRNGYKIDKINVDNVSSIGSNTLITRKGEMFNYDSKNSKLFDKMNFDKAVAKYIRHDDYDLILYQDGSLGFAMFDIFKMKITNRERQSSIHKVDLSTFPKLQDVIIGKSRKSRFLLGLTRDGMVYIAGGNIKGDKSEIILGKDSLLNNATIVENLPKSNKIGFLKDHNCLYAIAENGEVNYWFIETEDRSIKKLDQNALVILGDRLTTLDHKIRKLYKDRKNNLLLTKSIDDNNELLQNGKIVIIQEGPASRCIGISEKGKLMLGRRVYQNANTVMEMTVIDSIDVSQEYWNL